MLRHTAYLKELSDQSFYKHPWKEFFSYLFNSNFLTIKHKFERHCCLRFWRWFTLIAMSLNLPFFFIQIPWVNMCRWCKLEIYLFEIFKYASHMISETKLFLLSTHNWLCYEMKWNLPYLGRSVDDFVIRDSLVLCAVEFVVFHLFLVSF